MRTTGTPTTGIECSLLDKDNPTTKNERDPSPRGAAGHDDEFDALIAARADADADADGEEGKIAGIECSLGGDGGGATAEAEGTGKKAEADDGPFDELVSVRRRSKFEPLKSKADGSATKNNQRGIAIAAKNPPVVSPEPTPLSEEEGGIEWPPFELDDGAVDSFEEAALEDSDIGQETGGANLVDGATKDRSPPLRDSAESQSSRKEERDARESDGVRKIAAKNPFALGKSRSDASSKKNRRLRSKSLRCSGAGEATAATSEKAALEGSDRNNETQGANIIDAATVRAPNTPRSDETAAKKEVDRRSLGASPSSDASSTGRESTSKASNPSGGNVPEGSAPDLSVAGAKNPRALTKNRNDTLSKKNRRLRSKSLQCSSTGELTKTAAKRGEVSGKDHESRGADRADAAATEASDSPQSDETAKNPHDRTAAQESSAAPKSNATECSTAKFGGAVGCVHGNASALAKSAADVVKHAAGAGKIENAADVTAAANTAAAKTEDPKSTTPNKPSKAYVLPKTTTSNKASESTESTGIEWPLVGFENDATASTENTLSSTGGHLVAPRDADIAIANPPNITPTHAASEPITPVQTSSEPPESTGVKPHLPVVNGGAHALSDDKFSLTKDHHGETTPAHVPLSKRDTATPPSTEPKSKKPSAQPHSVGFECSFVSFEQDTTSTEKNADDSSVKQKKSPAKHVQRNTQTAKNRAAVGDNNSSNTEQQHQNCQQSDKNISLSPPAIANVGSDCGDSAKGKEVDKANDNAVAKKTFKKNISILTKSSVKQTGFDESASEKSKMEFKSVASGYSLEEKAPASVDPISKKHLKKSASILRKSSIKQVDFDGSASEKSTMESEPVTCGASLEEKTSVAVDPISKKPRKKSSSILRKSSIKQVGLEESASETTTLESKPVASGDSLKEKAPVTVDLISKKPLKKSSSILRKSSIKQVGFGGSVSEKSTTESKSVASGDSLKEKAPDSADACSEKPLKKSGIILKKSSAKQPGAKVSANVDSKVEPEHLLKADSLKELSKSQPKQRHPFGSLDGNSITRSVSKSFLLKKKNSTTSKSMPSDPSTKPVQEKSSSVKDSSRQPLLYFAPLLKLTTDMIESDSRNPNTKNEQQQVRALKKRALLRSFLVRQWLNVTRPSKGKRQLLNKPAKTKSVRFHQSSQELDDIFSSYGFGDSQSKPKKSWKQKNKNKGDNGLIGDIRDMFSIFSCFVANFSLEDEMHEFQMNIEEEISNYSCRLRDGTVDLFCKMEDLGLLSEEAVDELIHQHENLEDRFADLEDGFWNGFDKLNEKAAAGKEKMIESIVEAQELSKNKFLESKEFVMQSQSQLFAELNKQMHIMAQSLITDFQQISKLIVGDVDGTSWVEFLGSEVHELVAESRKWFDDTIFPADNTDRKLLTAETDVGFEISILSEVS